MFEQLGLDSSVLLFPMCSSSSCTYRDFSISPTCARRTEIDGLKKNAALRHTYFLTQEWAIGCGWVVGRKLHGTSQSRDNAEGEDGAGLFACCFALCDVGLGKKNITGSEERLSWQEPVKPVACEAFRRWICSWSPHSHHFLFQPI